MNFTIFHKICLNFINCIPFFYHSIIFPFLQIVTNPRNLSTSQKIRNGENVTQFHIQSNGRTTNNKVHRQFRSICFTAKFLSSYSHNMRIICLSCKKTKNKNKQEKNQEFRSTHIWLTTIRTSRESFK